MYLNEEAQVSMDVIEQINFVPPALTWDKLPNSQPFVLPQGCHYDGNVAPSDQCKSRFIFDTIKIFYDYISLNIYCSFLM